MSPCRADRPDVAHDAVFVGLLFWAWVWGMVLLAMPMLVAVKAVCDRVDDMKPVGELLGE